MDSIDTLWLLMATFLVLLMQIGFLLLEGGRVRSKNSVNVAQKNVTDMAVSWVCFMGFGFFIMFGITAPITDSSSVTEHAATPLTFLYQLAFCATAASIISGAVAERITFVSYLILTVLISGFIYPLVGRAVWGDLFNPDITAWFARYGFVDFAGATVVHGVGAGAGLIAIIMLGPRAGRFNEHGQPQPLAAHNSVLALTGALMLLFCWLGFNAGALSPSHPMFQTALMNTLTAAAFGSIGGLIVGARLDHGIFNPARTINGIIGGLVASTAAVNAMSPGEAVIVGATGGVLATVAADFLLHKCKLDDPLDVVATHGVAGIFGTVAYAFVAPVTELPTGSRLNQFAVQLSGSLLLLGFVCLTTWLTLTLVGRFINLRVTVDDEKLGLNYTEHGESVGTDKLRLALEARVQGVAGITDRFDDASNDEHSEIASAMNRLIDKHEVARNSIELSEQRLQHFAQLASDWLWETDAALRIIYLSNDCEDKWSNSPGRRYIGNPLFDLLDIDDKDIFQVKRCIKEHKATGDFEALMPSFDGEDAVMVEARAVPYFSLTGEYLGYRGIMCDVTPRKAAESRAVFLSLHDELTCLPNRRAFKERFAKLTKQIANKGHRIAIAVLDLDGFKSVNDRYGHAAGDELLEQVAERLRQNKRHDDMIFRTGGDEFFVVLTGFDSISANAKAQAACNRIIQDLSREYLIDTRPVNISASIGFALYPEHGTESDSLTRLADLAMYAAKASGKGRVVAFEPQMDTDAKHRRRLEADLLVAIEQRQFYMAYQPLIATDNEEVIGFEALIRWHHPDRGTISPAQFIPVAEELHLMDDIGRFALSEACGFASTWQQNLPSKTLTMAVNVSPDQLRSGDFPATVKTILNDTGLDPTRLELEITEDVLVDDFDHVTSILLELTNIGVSIAVDDFGSGQTSLRYLNNFPISKLKIDRSFIRHLGDNSKAAEITRSIVKLGRKLGVSVVAEGVEEQNQLDLLRSWDCDQVQGYLFAKPMAPDDAAMILLDTLKPLKKASGNYY